MRSFVIAAVAAGCGRVGFDDLGERDGATTFGDAADVCTPVRVLSIPYSGETALDVVAMPDGFAVLSAVRGGAPIYAAEFGLDWSLRNSGQLPIATDGLIAEYTDRLLTVVRRPGSLISDTGVVQFVAGVGPQLAVAAAAISLVPPEPGVLFKMSEGDWWAFAIDGGGGFTTWSLNTDGSSNGPQGGAGTGENSNVCSTSFDGATGFTMCSKPTQALCVLAFLPLSTRSYGWGIINDSCPNPALVATPGVVHGFFDTAGAGLRRASWSGTDVMNATVSVFTSTGSHPFAVADTRGVTVVYRDGAAVVALGMNALDGTITRPPAPVSGIPTALGIAGIGNGDRTMAFIAAADGLYRVCL